MSIIENENENDTGDETENIKNDHILEGSSTQHDNEPENHENATNTEVIESHGKLENPGVDKPNINPGNPGNPGNLEHNTSSHHLGLSTDEQRVMIFVQLHNPNDKYFMNWSNIYSLGEQYYSNYHGEVYRAYQNKMKLLTARYYNPKKYRLNVTNTQIHAFLKDPSQTKPVDTLDKPTFIDAQYEVDTGYSKVHQLRLNLEHNYKFLSGLPYVEPSDKKKLFKLRNNFIRYINAYYTIMYYYNRVNNYNMTEQVIILPNISLSYSENVNEMQPRIDKVTIRLSKDTINQKYNNDSAKLELYLAIKQLLHDLETSPKDNKKQDELNKLMHEYINFDKLYQSKLVNHINNLKNKKIINDLVILTGQLLPGDGSVTNSNAGMEDTIPGHTNLLTTNIKNKANNNSDDLDDLDEKARKRKFYFINRAKNGFN